MEVALTSATPLRAADVRGYCLQAQHLPKMDLFGSVDPYCVLSLGNQERKSRIIKKIYNPEWKEDPVRRCKRPLRPGVLQGLRRESRDWVFINVFVRESVCICSLALVESTSLRSSYPHPSKRGS